jgi:hypothetical protein
VKQSDIREYEENARVKQKIQIYKIKHQLPLKPSHKDGEHQFPPQISKARSIEEFGENISQLSRYRCISSQYIPSQCDLSGSGVSSQGVSFSCGRLDFWL